MRKVKSVLCLSVACGLFLFASGCDDEKELSESEIFTEITSYVAENFPTNFITDRELEDNSQQVGLNNDLDLEFTKDGEFIRVDS
jgi:hypothetical protein